MKKRKNSPESQPEETVPDEAARADGENAPPEPEAEHPLAFPDPRQPPDQTAAPPEPLTVEPAPLVAGFDAPPAPAPPAWQDFPVASVLPPMAPLLHAPAVPNPLEDRLRRLESELAELRNAPTIEPRVGLPPAPDPAAVVRQRGNFWAGLGQRMLTPSGPTSAPPRSEGLASMVPAGVRRTWILLDALTELRAMYWMFFDPRYRLSWTARLGPLAILALILTSYYWTSLALCAFGWVVDKFVDVVLAYVLFKLLSYEARRYRETAPDLPPSLRQ